MSASSVSTGPTRRPIQAPRLGFLGMGWIGRNRMEALLREQVGTVVAVADPDPQASHEAARIADGALALGGLEELLELDLDGLVIATPSALHAPQAIAALERGVAVFAQKPMARSADEAQTVLDAARAAGRPFGVDLSYRHTAAAQRMRGELQEGRIGDVFGAKLVFHNAYGPDKEWFLDRRRSGGGCLIDLGTHLIDLLLWMVGTELEVEAVRLLRAGRPVTGSDSDVEDFAVVQLSMNGGAPVQLACSWFLPAGCECELECTLYGTDGSLALTNVAGSFYDFRLESRRGTQTQTLVSPPDDWGGRALCDWARRVQRGEDFDPQLASELHAATRVLDDIYRRGAVAR